MKTIMLSAPKGNWCVVEVREDGTLWKLPIEQWALVQWEKYRDSDALYNEGQTTLPQVMGPSGLVIITDPIGAPGCRYLGYQLMEDKRNWEKERQAYLKRKEPS